MLKVHLVAVGNPDRDQPEDIGIPKETVEVSTLEEASARCRKFIEDHRLGGGNWIGGDVYDEKGARVARISYNGRIWLPGSDYFSDK